MYRDTGQYEGDHIAEQERGRGALHVFEGCEWFMHLHLHQINTRLSQVLY